MRLLTALLVLAFAAPAFAQSSAAPPFTLELVEVDLAAMPGLHSFAWAEHDRKWLFVAGRTDGLHGIVEMDAFPAEQANDAVWVVDPVADQVWSQSLDELDDAVADPLRATNPEFYQEGETLYIVGGYGTDSATGTKITFPILSALDVPGLVDAVTTGGALAPHIRQMTDERLAVTGGELRPDDGPFGFEGGYLLFGGQRFDGEYSVNGTGFTQAYTERVFSFMLDDDGTTLGIQEVYSVTDEDALHRRDMTVAPTYLQQVGLEGAFIGEGYGLYGGVFRPDANLPLRSPLFFEQTDLAGHVEYRESSFEQQFAHYTAPALPLWDAEKETMHTTFFGGMAQFYMDEATGEIKQDLLVPFTDDIVTLTADLTADGDLAEAVMPVQMPGLLGANAVMIPASDAPRSELGIVRLREVQGRTLMGWIVGGLHSTMPNPGWSGMTAAETSASDRVFAVYLTPDFGTASEPTAGPAEIDFEGPYPNPFRAEATVAITLRRSSDLVVEVFDVLGRRVAVLHDGPLGAQRHTFTFRPDDLPSGVYTVRVHGEDIHATRSVVRIR